MAMLDHAEALKAAREQQGILPSTVIAPRPLEIAEVHQLNEVLLVGGCKHGRTHKQTKRRSAALSRGALFCLLTFCRERRGRISFQRSSVGSRKKDRIMAAKRKRCFLNALASLLPRHKDTAGVTLLGFVDWRRN